MLEKNMNLFGSLNDTIQNKIKTFRYIISVIFFLILGTLCYKPLALEQVLSDASSPMGLMGFQNEGLGLFHAS